MNENQCQSYSTLYPRHYHRFNQWKSTWSLYLNDARLIKIPIFFTKLTARAAHTQTHTSWLKWLCLWNWYKNLFFFRTLNSAHTIDVTILSFTYWYKWWIPWFFNKFIHLSVGFIFLKLFSLWHFLAFGFSILHTKFYKFTLYLVFESLIFFSFRLYFVLIVHWKWFSIGKFL